MRFVLLACCLCAAACSADPTGETYGANPSLAPPRENGPFPTVKVAEAVGWPADGAPVAPAGFSVTRFAEGLDHPRWILVLPNNDVLVAEASTKPEEGGGLVGWVRNSIQRRAGALAGSADRITLLRDSNRDGIVDQRSVFAENLNQPFGMAIGGGYVYIGNTDAVVRFPYALGDDRLTGQPETVLRLPYNADGNGHWTRDVRLSPDGSKLFVAVGSVSNAAEQGMQIEEGRAAIWTLDLDGSNARVFASGLRNPVGLAFNSETQALWAVVNERDMLGDDLVPDYITSVREGGFYGWPYSYYGQNVDARVEPQNPDLVARAIVPDYAVGAHTGSLGLHFYTGGAFPASYANGAFIGQHGSWNRSAHVGYKVIFVPFANGQPAGDAQDFLTGFLNARGQAQGRPVGVAQDATGALLVADDVGNIVWRVSYSAGPDAGE